MASLQIPERHFDALAQILTLPGEAIQELQSALESVPTMLYPSGPLSKSVSNLHAISKTDAKKISDALLSLYMTRASTDKSTSDFVDEIIQAINEKDDERLKLADESHDEFKQRLTALLSVNSFAIATRATSLLYEHDNNFSKVRIVTDIRPVFEAKAEDPVAAAIIIHTLNFHYFEGAQHKEFYVAMDTKDLQALKDAIKRAEKKVQSLNAVLKKANIRYVQPE